MADPVVSGTPVVIGTHRHHPALWILIIGVAVAGALLYSGVLSVNNEVAQSSLESLKTQAANLAKKVTEKADEVKLKAQIEDLKAKLEAKEAAPATAPPPAATEAAPVASAPASAPETATAPPVSAPAPAATAPAAPASRQPKQMAITTQHPFPEGTPTPYRCHIDEKGHIVHDEAGLGWCHD